MITALVLVVLAVVLAGPGPLWVARWQWLHQVPRSAIILWQAGAVAALIAVVGAGVVLFHYLPQTHGPVRWIVAIALLVFIGHVIVRLIWFGLLELRRSGLRRREHRALVDLVAQAESGDQGRHWVLAHDEPVAYCLPGLLKSRVVVSRGTVDTLSADEFEAVLAHERAHLRARHDIVLDTFGALHKAFPVLIRSELPLIESRVLVEMMADDHAIREVGTLPLARALTELAGTRAPAAALGAGPMVLQRITRLSRLHPQRRLLAVGAGLLAAGQDGRPRSQRATARRRHTTGAVNWVR